ncbi:response regulator [Rhizorhabdus histidinilytica]
MLHSFGFPSFAAQSPAEAFEKIGNRSISTLIIDQNLPGLDGISLAEDLAARTADEGRELRFIMVAEHATLDLVVAAVRASVVDILQKPITRDDLRNALLRVRGIKPESSTRKALASQLTTLSLEIQRLSNLMDEALPSFGKSAPVPEPASDEPVSADSSATCFARKPSAGRCSTAGCSATAHGRSCSTCSPPSLTGARSRSPAHVSHRARRQRPRCG